MRTVDLNAVPAGTWNMLAAGRGPWRIPVLASVADGQGDARTVVLRAVSPRKRELVFFTDRRSGKYEQIARVPGVCLLVYDTDVQLQVRLYGNACEETASSTLDAWWIRLGERQRAHYAAAMVGGRLVPGKENGRTNFTAFRVRVDRFHCLWLDEDGNQAAEFGWDGAWTGRFVRP